MTEASVTGDATAGYVVTNTHVPETVEVAGSKTWDDNDDAEGTRPLSITIRLRANGAEVASRNVTAADGWAWSFADLPARKNGVRIQYTIAEDAVRDYSSHIAGYDAVNTYAPGKMQVQVHHIMGEIERYGVRNQVATRQLRRIQLAFEELIQLVLPSLAEPSIAIVVEWSETEQKATLTMSYNGPASDVTARMDSLVGNVLRVGTSQVEYAWDEAEVLANRITVSIRQG